MMLKLIDYCYQFNINIKWLILSVLFKINFIDLFV